MAQAPRLAQTALESSPFGPARLGPRWTPNALSVETESYKGVKYVTTT